MKKIYKKIITSIFLLYKIDQRESIIKQEHSIILERLLHYILFKKNIDHNLLITEKVFFKNGHFRYHATIHRTTTVFHCIVCVIHGRNHRNSNEIISSGYNDSHHHRSAHG